MVQFSQLGPSLVNPSVEKMRERLYVEVLVKDFLLVPRREGEGKTKELKESL